MGDVNAALAKVGDRAPLFGFVFPLEQLKIGTRVFSASPRILCPAIWGRKRFEATVAHGALQEACAVSRQQCRWRHLLIGDSGAPLCWCCLRAANLTAEAAWNANQCLDSWSGCSLARPQGSAKHHKCVS